MQGNWFQSWNNPIPIHISVLGEKSPFSVDSKISLRIYQLPGLTTEQFYRLLLPFVASLRDGHTALLQPQSGAPQQSGLPLTFKIIDESLVVDSAPTTPASKVVLPDMSRSDVAWQFLDKTGKTALLKIDDMSTYREACEEWLASGMAGGEEMARAAYRKFNEKAAPEAVEDILAGIPSATDVFKELVVAMKRQGTTLLIVDLRENTGGNDLMVQMLLYFLFGKEAMTTYDAGFQISRYSNLCFQVYANESLSNINRNRLVPLEIGDYDFAHEQAKENGGDSLASTSEYRESLKNAPTFYKVFNQDVYANYYHPPKLAALSSAWTYSSGFTMLAALESLGAMVVGTPSAHAGNNFGDSLPFQLTNTQLRGAVSFKQNVTFPNDPVKGHCLRPDYILTNKKWAELEYDPNAEVLMAIKVSEQKAQDNSDGRRGCPGASQY